MSGSAGGRTEKDPRTAGTSPYGLPNRVASSGEAKFSGRGGDIRGSLER